MKPRCGLNRGHGSKQDHSLQLFGDQDGGGGTLLESGDHSVYLVTGVSISLNADVERFFEVPKDSGDSGSAILCQKLVPHGLSSCEFRNFLLNGSVGMQDDVTHGHIVLLGPIEECSSLLRRGLRRQGRLLNSAITIIPESKGH
jgi:hypothetical protein